MRKFLLFSLIITFAKCVQMHGVHLTIPNLGMLNGTVGSTAWTNQSFYKFMNVKFAESPSGPNRFKEPIPVQPWNGYRDSTEYGRMCPIIFYLSHYNSTIEDLEDCLHVAIFTKDVNASRAVMLFVLDGGFFNGSARDSPREFLIEKDIVFVSTQYRLGPLGFLSTMSNEIPGNAALLDVVAALEFIQKYIRYFGGDPNNVTIVGQSAGAAIVSTLLYSPRVNASLFQRAIVQSGALFGNWAIDRNPIESAHIMGRTDGCNVTTIDDLNECLMSMDIYTLLTAHIYLQLLTPVLVGGTTPILCGPSEFLPYEWEDLQTIVPLNRNVGIMTGVTAHDGTFMFQGTAAYAPAEKKQLLRNRHNAYIYQLSELAPMPNSAVDMIDFVLSYGGYTDPSGILNGMQLASLFNTTEIRNGTLYGMVNGLGDLISNLGFKSPNLNLAHSSARYNRNNTYLYTFDYVGEYTMGPPISPDYPFYGGVHHADELLYLFALQPLNSNDTIMAQRMVEYWTSFVITGIPNYNVTWPPFTHGSGPYMHLNWNLEIGDNFYEEFFVSTRKWSINRNSRLFNKCTRKFLSKFEYMRRDKQMEFLNKTKLIAGGDISNKQQIKML